MGSILKWDGTAWATQSLGLAPVLYGVWGSDAKNVWAVGFSGAIFNGDYEPSTCTYTDLRRELSRQLRASSQRVRSAFRTRHEAVIRGRSDLEL